MITADLRRWLFSGAVACALLLAGPAARAQQPAAEALFREGRRLVDAGKLIDACAKFAESQRLDPASGTLLNLGDCNERLGRTATAWSYFVAAGTLAEAQGKPDQRSEARLRAEAVEGRLAHLTIRAAKPVTAMLVKRDEVLLGPAALGTRTPIDPGRYRISASAPAHRDWSTEVTIAGDRADESVVIPELATAPIDAPRASARVPLWAWISGGAGLALLAIGIAFEVDSVIARDTIVRNCGPERLCDPAGHYDPAYDNDRKNRSFALFVGFGLGGAAATAASITGIALALGNARADTKTFTFTPTVSPSAFGAAISGHF